MKVSTSMSFHSQFSMQHWRWAPGLVGALGFALLSGCAVNAPSCDGRFEPINAPAPVNVTPAGEDRAATRDTRDE